MKRELNIHYELPKIVPWRKVDGEEVTTNGFMEDALGLTHLIVGWCGGGFYCSREVDPKVLEAKLDTINWHRAKYVYDNFWPRAAYENYLVVTDQAQWSVTERRFQRLMSQCFNSVKDEKYEHELAMAIKRATYKGNVHGQLKE